VANRSTGATAPHTPETRSTADAGMDDRLRVPVTGESFDVSATVAGIDGAVIGTVTTHREAGATGRPSSQPPIVISVTGDIDADTSPLLHTALTKALQAHRWVCCDLSRVDFFGAAGANTIVAAHQHATAAGRHLTVRGVHGLTRLVLTITGLDQVVAVTEQIDANGVPAAPMTSPEGP
jgi:anti-anti-sigma factor